MLQPQETVKSRISGPILDLERFRSASLKTHPFDYVIVSNFIRPEWENRLIDAYPHIEKGGSFPLSTVKFGVDFSKLIGAMNGAEFREDVGEKISHGMEGRPTTSSVMSRCSCSKGHIDRE